MKDLTNSPFPCIMCREPYNTHSNWQSINKEVYWCKKASTKKRWVWLGIYIPMNNLEYIEWLYSKL